MKFLKKKHALTIAVLVLILTTLFIVHHRGSKLSTIGKAATYGARGKVTFRVVNHEGSTIPNAEVRVTVFTGNIFAGDEYDVLHKTTDAKGRLIIEKKTTGGMILWVRKEGYYETYFDYSFADDYKHGDPSELFLKDGRWLPWNPSVDVLLKPKLNPIPMFVKRVDRFEVPVEGEPVGYDFEKADWVAPYGKGQISDLYFDLKGEMKDPWTGSNELIISAPGQQSGLQIMKKDLISEFHTVHQAPLKGYQKKVGFAFKRTKTKMIENTELEDNEYLVFRTRTKLDEDGNLVEACYGKIYPPVRFGVYQNKTETGAGIIKLWYYFNPSGTRNLEFDTENNLFKDEHGSPIRVGDAP
jgi:hypothetical protein